ncbi:cell division protein FtsQ [Pedobacter sp. SD-b]|uniref:Cell division protein FtsQ n=1 Tax=Pedobacter segetis TaxID=2793069 RepID=A0ABS1BKF4_9SPHI|nr:cell division protein FtsQ [Pedobacter segetis]MBK0383375.1 cell division protein FtsQ [Pedobacter segetis]
MFKRINWKAVGIMFVWLLSLSGVITLMSFIKIKKAENTCQKVEVILPGNQFFVERAEIDDILKDKNGLLVGRRLENINIQKLEDKLKANPFIEYAKVYIDMDGVLHADVKQRVPVLRILNMVGQDFYVDQNGLKIPLSDYFTARVLVANGAILESYNDKIDTLKTQVAKDLFTTAKFIDADSLWSRQIVQIYVNNQKDMELVPRVGKQKIILGNADLIDEKFRNLLIFYKQAIPKVGWDAYSTINLKFKNQIVCVKADSTLIKKKPIEIKPDSAANQIISKDSTNNIY